MTTGIEQTVTTEQDFDASAITRPVDSLLTYYLFVSLCTLVAFPLVFVPLFIRFKSAAKSFLSI